MTAATIALFFEDAPRRRQPARSKAAGDHALRASPLDLTRAARGGGVGAAGSPPPGAHQGAQKRGGAAARGREG
jgi:hypothetical protein